jgi:hypothetical protein
MQPHILSIPRGMWVFSLYEFQLDIFTNSGNKVKSNLAHVITDNEFSGINAVSEVKQDNG